MKKTKPTIKQELAKRLAKVGDRIRQWRQEEGLKIFQLAEKINVSQGSLSDIENNKSLPSAETLASISLNTSLDANYVLTGQYLVKNEKLEKLDALEFPLDEHTSKILVYISPKVMG